MRQGAIEKVQLLPSQFWVDFSDYWVCHPDEKHVVPIEGALKARAGRCLVGEAHYLVHTSNVCAGALRHQGDAHNDDSTDSTTPLAGIRLYCRRCEAPTGETASHGGVQLYKDRVIAAAAASDSTATNALAKYTLGTRVAVNLVAKAEADGQYRFLVCAGDSGRAGTTRCPRLQLTLVNWDLSLFGNHRAAGSCARAGTRWPVVKVLWKDKASGESMDAWAKQFGAHRVVLPDEECWQVTLHHPQPSPRQCYASNGHVGLISLTCTVVLASRPPQLQASLARSHALLPPSCGRIDGSRVAFLFVTGPF